VRRSLARPAASAIALAAGLLTAAPALAGGMQLQTRGVRPTARAGAFVAGANDLGAMWFNPAGVASLAGDGDDRHFLVDFAYVRQSVTYERIDSGNNPRDPVENDAPGLPIPTLGISFALNDRLVIAAGIYAPYAGLARYPTDGAQRYSLIDLSETLLVYMQATVAFQVTERLRVGAGVQNLFASLSSTLVFSGCPGQTVCAPEDPEFDALSRVDQRDYFNPSGVVGVQYDASRRARVGLAVQLPVRVSGDGEFQTVLPSSGFYDGAEVVGDRAELAFTIPAMVRAGIELAPADRWRVELAGSVELWSQHDEFTIEPQDVRIEGAPGVGTYELGPLDLPRHYDNSYAVMLGFEGQPLASMPLRLMGGYSYETAAAPDAYLSVLTVDSSKHLIAGGAGYQFGSVTLDAVAGFVAMAPRQVTPEEGRSPQLNPVRDESDEPLEVFVNWGEYRSSWIILGLSLRGVM
jgi:long-chain fatty acid transport protein